jgi:hypothetical protein
MLPKKLEYERQAEKKESKFFSVFLCLTMLLITCLALSISYFSLQNEIPALYQSVLSLRWSKADGKITKIYTSTKSVTAGSAKNPRSATVYVPKINYSFQTGSETLTGERMNFSGEEKYFPLEKESLEYVNSLYQINQTVEVFHHPTNPQESALSREYVYNSDNYLSGCGCGFMGIFFSLLCWLSFRDLIKYFRQKKLVNKK